MSCELSVECSNCLRLDVADTIEELEVVMANHICFEDEED